MSFFGERAPTLPEESPAQPAEPPAWHHALIIEAAAKSSVLWITLPETPRAHLAWYVWHQEAVHLVTGPGEQSLPLMSGPVLLTIPSKDDRSTILTCTATATVCPANNPGWVAAASALAAARLNAELPEELLARWATDALVYRIDPVALISAGPGSPTTDSGARASSPLGVTTRRRPWHLGGRR